MARLCIVLLACGLGCRSQHEPTSQPSAVTSIATPVDAIAAPDANTTFAGDPAEPVWPQGECVFEQRPVHCEVGVPTRRPQQPAPFEWCRPTLPASKLMVLGSTGRLFSAVRTREARTTTPDACCYLEWTWSICD